MVKFTRAVPVIGTRDVAGTIRYFETVLGFEEQFVWGDPPVYAGVAAGETVVYICHDAELADAILERRLGPDLFLWVAGIDEAYQRHKANGAAIYEELSLRPWGVRQYVIREPNGYLLKIAETEGID